MIISDVFEHTSYALVIVTLALNRYEQLCQFHFRSAIPAAIRGRDALQAAMNSAKVVIGEMQGQRGVQVL